MSEVQQKGHIQKYKQCFCFLLFLSCSGILASYVSYLCYMSPATINPLSFQAALTVSKRTELLGNKNSLQDATGTGRLNVKNYPSTQGSQEKLVESAKDKTGMKSIKKIQLKRMDTKHRLYDDYSSFNSKQEKQGDSKHDEHQTTTAIIWQTITFPLKQNNKRQVNQTQMNISGSNVTLDVKRRGCSKIKCQYVIWQCHHDCMGWGDRLRGIISVYAFAILTGREYRISHTFPCNLKKFFHGNKTPWDKEDITAKHATTRDIKLFGYKLPFQNWVLKSSDLLETFPEDIITFRTNVDIIPYLRFNKNFTKTIEKAFNMPIEDFHYVTLFRRLFHELFNPNKQFEEKFQKYYKLLKPSNDSTLVCAQIRLQFIKVSGMKNVFKFLQETIKRVGKSKLLVSTDAENVRLAAKTLFPDQLVDIEGPLGHVDKPGSGCRDMEKALIDFLLLSKCDILIHSPSGFGQQAAMLKYPYKDVYQIGRAGIIKKLKIPVFKLEYVYEELGRGAAS